MGGDVSFLLDENSKIQFQTLQLLDANERQQLLLALIKVLQHSFQTYNEHKKNDKQLDYEHITTDCNKILNDYRIQTSVLNYQQMQENQFYIKIIFKNAILFTDPAMSMKFSFDNDLQHVLLFYFLTDKPFNLMPKSLIYNICNLSYQLFATEDYEVATKFIKSFSYVEFLNKKPKIPQNAKQMHTPYIFHQVINNIDEKDKKMYLKFTQYLIIQQNIRVNPNYTIQVLNKLGVSQLSFQKLQPFERNVFQQNAAVTNIKNQYYEILIDINNTQNQIFNQLKNEMLTAINNQVENIFIRINSAHSQIQNIDSKKEKIDEQLKTIQINEDDQMLACVQYIIQTVQDESFFKQLQKVVTNRCKQQIANILQFQSMLFVKVQYQQLVMLNQNYKTKYKRNARPQSPQLNQQQKISVISQIRCDKFPDIHFRYLNNKMMYHFSQMNSEKQDIFKQLLSLRIQNLDRNNTQIKEKYFLNKESLQYYDHIDQSIQSDLPEFYKRNQASIQSMIKIKKIMNRLTFTNMQNNFQKHQLIFELIFTLLIAQIETYQYKIDIDSSQTVFFEDLIPILYEQSNSHDEVEDSPKLKIQSPYINFTQIALVQLFQFIFQLNNICCFYFKDELCNIYTVVDNQLLTINVQNTFQYSIKQKKITYLYYNYINYQNAGSNIQNITKFPSIDKIMQITKQQSQYFTQKFIDDNEYNHYAQISENKYSYYNFNQLIHKNNQQLFQLVLDIINYFQNYPKYKQIMLNNIQIKLMNSQILNNASFYEHYINDDTQQTETELMVITTDNKNSIDIQQLQKQLWQSNFNQNCSSEKQQSKQPFLILPQYLNIVKNQFLSNKNFNIYSITYKSVLDQKKYFTTTKVFKDIFQINQHIIYEIPPQQLIQYKYLLFRMFNDVSADIDKNTTFPIIDQNLIHQIVQTVIQQIKICQLKQPFDQSNTNSNNASFNYMSSMHSVQLFSNKQSNTQLMAKAQQQVLQNAVFDVQITQYDEFLLIQLLQQQNQQSQLVNDQSCILHENSSNSSFATSNQFERMLDVQITKVQKDCKNIQNDLEEIY